MRALLVAAAPGGSSDLVRALAASADLIVAVDGGALLCLEADTTPSLVIGDLDSLPAADADRLRAAGVHFETHPAEKDDTDLALAFAAAEQHGATAVVATGIVGGRYDHSLAATAVTAGYARLRPLIVERDVTMAFLADGGPLGCKVSGEGATFSVVALGGEALVSISSARWPLDHRPLTWSSTLGVSNVVAGPSAGVRLHAGSIVVIAPTVAGRQARLSYDD